MTDIDVIYGPPPKGAEVIEIEDEDSTLDSSSVDERPGN